MPDIPAKKFEGKYWAFTPDGKQFFTLKLYDEYPPDYCLLDAYRRHPKRLPEGVNVGFVYRDDTRTGPKIVHRVSMADILAYEVEMRQIQEDAAQQRDEGLWNPGD